MFYCRITHTYQNYSSEFQDTVNPAYCMVCISSIHFWLGTLKLKPLYGLVTPRPYLLNIYNFQYINNNLTLAPTLPHSIQNERFYFVKLHKKSHHLYVHYTIICVCLHICQYFEGYFTESSCRHKFQNTQRQGSWRNDTYILEWTIFPRDNSSAFCLISTICYQEGWR